MKSGYKSKLEVYIMMGIPASGKSYFTKQKPPEVGIVSKDLLKGNAKKERMMLEQMLQSGKSVIVDDTNYTKAARKEIIDIAQKYHAKVIGIYIKTDKKTALQRNKARPNKVPEIAIHTIAKKFEEPELDEGFDEIVTYEDEITVNEFKNNTR